MTSKHFDELHDEYNKIIVGKNREELSDSENEHCYLLAHQLVAIDPKESLAWYSLGQIELLNGDFHEAKKYYEKALELSSVFKPQMAYDYAVILHELGDIRGALQEMQKVVHEVPDDDTYNELMAVCLDEAGFTGRALAIFRKTKDPEIIKLYESAIEEYLSSVPFYKNGGYFDVNNAVKRLSSYPLIIPFDKQKLPELHTNDSGKSYYIDRISGSLRQVTPEETVRQNVLSYLITQLSIPKQFILVEESLSHVDRDIRGRVDILVRIEVKEKIKNLLLIECKEPNVSIEGDPVKQALEYNEILTCPFVLITNGFESLCYLRDKSSGDYLPTRELPNLQILLDEKIVNLADVDDVEWTRPDWPTIHTTKYIDQQREYFNYIGPSTDIKIAPVIINIGHGLMDESYQLHSGQRCGHIEILSDLGVCNKRVGNPSGGSYEGQYRWLKIKDRHGREQSVYLGVFSTAEFESDKGNKVGGYSSLVFAIDHNNKPLSVFQLNMNKYFQATSTTGSNSWQVTHSGIRNRGNVEELFDFVSQIEPDLIHAGKIYLGNLTDDHNFTFADKDFVNFILRIINYSLLRFELRTKNEKKKRRKRKRHK